MNCFFIKYGNNEIQAGQAIQYIGGFHNSFTVHRTTLDGQLHAYCRFVPYGSEQIPRNCIYILPNTRSIHIMNNKLDLITVSIYLGWPPSAKHKAAQRNLEAQGQKSTLGPFPYRRISLLSVGPGVNCTFSPSLWAALAKRITWLKHSYIALWAQNKVYCWRFLFLCLILGYLGLTQT